MSYDFERAAQLLNLYVSINKDGLSQLLPIANAAMEELKQMMADEDNAATFADPNPGVNPETTDHDGDGLVTSHDQNIEDGVEDDDTDEDTTDPTTPTTSPRIPVRRT